MTSWYVFDTLTGNILQEFTPRSGSWSIRSNEPESLQVVIPLSDPDLAALNWAELASPWRSSLAVEEHGRLYGGPILPHNFDDDKFELTITAKGIWSYLDRLFVLPPSAEATSLVLTSGLPNRLMDSTFSGWDLGTIAKKIVQQACSWTGANIPVAYQPDRIGSRTRTYEALDFKPVGEALTDITNVRNGPDIRFQLRYRNASAFEWFMETGTETQPRLQSTYVPTWDLAAEDATGSGLRITTDPTGMADVSWATGGRSQDRVLVSMRKTTRLRAAGFPLLMTVDSSHSEVSDPATLDGYASEPLRTGYVPAQFWAFKVQANTSPILSDYAVGDLCNIHVEDNPYIPTGDHVRRIAGLSGDEQGQWITVTLGEVYDG